MKSIDILTIILGLIPYVLISIGVIKGSVKQSFATWLLWFILDVIVLFGVFDQDGNPYLFSAFALGTGIVTILLVVKKQVSWSSFETYISWMVTVCIIVYLLAGPHLAIIATVLALNIAGIPQVIATFKDPKATPTIAYSLFAISALLSAISAKAWTVEDMLPAISTLIYASTVAILSLRKNPDG